MAHRGGPGHPRPSYRALLGTALLAAGDAQGGAPHNDASDRRCIAGRSSRRPTARPVTGNLVVARAGARRQRPDLAKARDVLERAYGFLLEGIANVRDVGLRRSYLNKVIANREHSRGVGRRRHGAQTAAPARPRASDHPSPMSTKTIVERLADTGLRLNGLRERRAAIRIVLTSRKRSRYPAPSACCLFLQRDDCTRVAESHRAGGRGRRQSRSARSNPISRGPTRTEIALLLHTPASATQVNQRSRIVAPLLAAG